MGSIAMLALALFDGRAPLVAALLFIPVNLDLRLRGPPG